MTNFELHLTDSAKDQVQKLMAEAECSIVGLRITVISGGCVGYKYNFTLERETDYGDFILNMGAVTIIVDDKSALLLNGSTIDYIREVMSARFKITNPNLQISCGCGESFG